MTKLIPGKEYGFRVRAENRFGISEPIYSDRIIARYPFGEFLLKYEMRIRETAIMFSGDQKPIY